MLLVGYLIQVVGYSGAYILCGVIEVLALIVFMFYTLPRFEKASYNDYS